MIFFLDIILLITLSCEFRGHRAGSQLKIYQKATRLPLNRGQASDSLVVVTWSSQRQQRQCQRDKGFMFLETWITDSVKYVRNDRVHYPWSFHCTAIIIGSVLKKIAPPLSAPNIRHINKSGILSCPSFLSVWLFDCLETFFLHILAHMSSRSLYFYIVKV